MGMEACAHNQGSFLAPLWDEWYVIRELLFSSMVLITELIYFAFVTQFIERKALARSHVGLDVTQHSSVLSGRRWGHSIPTGTVFCLAL